MNRVFLFFALLTFISSCRTMPEGDAAAKRETAGGVSVVAVQYVASVGNAGAETVEVLLRNGMAAPVSFVRAELDGTELPPIKPMAQKALDAFRFGTDVMKSKRPAQQPVAGTRWWQFYPSSDMPAGGHVAFQLNFAERSRACDLVLTVADGQTIPVHIPRYSPPKRRIEYLAFTGDGKTMSLRYSKGAPPVAVSINGHALKDFKALAPSGAGRPGAIAATLPRPVREGESVLVELEFPDGEKRHAFIRAMLAAGSDTPFLWTYLPGSDLKSSLAYPNGLTASWTYDANGQLLQVCNATPTNIISQYDYVCDAAGRRVEITRSGSAMSEPRTDVYGYNIRNELISAAKLGGTGAATTEYAYQYDDIGNRISSFDLGMNRTYAANNLNQYTSISNSASSVPSAGETFLPQFDDDGNQTLIQTATGIWSLTYNGENRPIFWSNGITNIVMQFDRMGRRVQYLETCSATTNSSNTFTCDNYLLIARNHHAPDGTIATDRFIWDITELVATRPLVSYIPYALPLYYSHDGNKNVSCITTLDASLALYYDYAPFGSATVLVGASAFYNLPPISFSSEYVDVTIGVSQYNYRSYNIQLGNWGTRDSLFDFALSPIVTMVDVQVLNKLKRIGIEGNLYGYCVSSNPLLSFDVLGLGSEFYRHGTCCNNSSENQWALVAHGNAKAQWEELVPGACVGSWFNDADCEGITCGGGFYKVKGYETGSCVTPGCDSWPYKDRRWTPTKQGNSAESPEKRGGKGIGNYPPGYKYAVE